MFDSISNTLMRRRPFHKTSASSFLNVTIRVSRSMLFAAVKQVSINSSRVGVDGRQCSAHQASICWRGLSGSFIQSVVSRFVRWKSPVTCVTSVCDTASICAICAFSSESTVSMLSVAESDSESLGMLILIYTSAR